MAPGLSSQRGGKAGNSELKIVSANVRGFHTNIAELSHSVITRHRADVVFVCETFLDDNVPPSYARIRGYSAWLRKDRSTQGGGVAFCHKETINAQVVEPPVPVPSELEILTMKIIDSEGKGLLCVGCYRPPSQGTTLLDFLTVNLDAIMTASQCDSVVIVGDLNQHRVRDAFNTLLVVHDLHNHVTFPTHISGSSLDPVVTDLPPHTVQCQPMDFVGTSDHVAVLTRIAFRRPREESYTRTLWKWEAANWTAMRASLRMTDWEEVLCGNTDQQVEHLTELLLSLQERWVPHSKHSTKPSDLPWFGPECRAASDAKYRAWRAYKRHPTARNRQMHREASQQMRHTQEWAMEQWKECLRGKLRGGQVGTKRWWSLVKDQQGESRESTVPPLQREDGVMAHSALDKANLLAKHFAGKMCIPDPERTPPTLPDVVSDKLVLVRTSESEVKDILRKLDVNKAVGPDKISPRLLYSCADELAKPLTSLFNHCLQISTWPKAWKTSNVVPVHKKGGKSEVKNYRPVSLLPVLSKVVETIVASRVTEHLEKHHLLCTRQFGFRQGRSAADLHLLLTSELSAALDQGKKNAVVALDIEGAFDRVWHEALVTKLRAAGIDGALLPLLKDYLRDRQLKVTVGGRESEVQPIRAGVPQGSCLGPLLWNIYINDLLHLIPRTKAYADDVTLAQSYDPEEEAAVTARLNYNLSRIVAWGNKWQVRFASHKTQLLIVSRSCTSLRLNFNGNTLTPRDEMEVLGVTYDQKLTFSSHIERLARQASGKLASLRRMSWLLDGRGLEVLYKAQVRSSLEYACLAWGGAAKKHLSLLDKVQDRVTRLISDSSGGPEPHLHTLQHRRDVAGLTVMFKVQEKHVSHLQELRQPHRRATVATRAVALAPRELLQPRCRTCHYQRQFINTYTGWWNTLLATQTELKGASVQGFKVIVNDWLLKQAPD